MIFINRLNPTTGIQTNTLDLEVAGPLRPADYSFEIGFGLGKHLDPSYGHFTVYNFQSVLTGNVDANGDSIRNTTYTEIGL